MQGFPLATLFESRLPEPSIGTSEAPPRLHAPQRSAMLGIGIGGALGTGASA